MLINTIVEGLPSIRRGGVVNHLFFEDPSACGENGFLFFLKPELLPGDADVDVEAVLSMVLERCGEHGLRARSVRGLSAGYLRKHRIIARHYSVINQIASDPRGAVSEGARETFAETFGETFADAPVIGGIELLGQYPNLNAVALDYLWQNLPVRKLAGGTYASGMELDGERLYLFNGFHPRQLEHFVRPGRCIVVFLLVGDVDWATARQKFVGTTNPAEAVPGSIRRVLFDRCGEFGLSAITSSWNGVHLSAGPLEGLVEAIRYLSDFEKDRPLGLDDFTFGKRLVAAFGREKAEAFLDNPDVVHEGRRVSAFDLTEEMNPGAAIARLAAAG